MVRLGVFLDPGLDHSFRVFNGLLLAYAVILAGADARALLIYGVVAPGVTPAHQAVTVVNRDKCCHDFILCLQLEAWLYKVWSN